MNFISIKLLGGEKSHEAHTKYLTEGSRTHPLPNAPLNHSTRKGKEEKLEVPVPLRGGKKTKKVMSVQIPGGKQTASAAGCCSDIRKRGQCFPGAGRGQLMKVHVEPSQSPSIPFVSTDI